MSDYFDKIHQTLYKYKTPVPIQMNTSNYIMNTSDYGLNIFIVFLFILIILFLYVINHVSVDEKNWDIQKCNPKYVFFSGYIRRNPNQDSYDSTINNFYECNNKLIQGLNQDVMDSSLGKSAKAFKNKIVQFERDTNPDHLNIQEVTADISDQLAIVEQDISLNITKDTTFSYTYLKHMGIYIDQLNSYLDYIGAYVKKVLTYKMMEHASNCMKDPECQNGGHEHYGKAIKIKNVLNTYYGGTNL